MVLITTIFFLFLFRPSMYIYAYSIASNNKITKAVSQRLRLASGSALLMSTGTLACEGETGLLLASRGCRTQDAPKEQWPGWSGRSGRVQGSGLVLLTGVCSLCLGLSLLHC